MGAYDCEIGSRVDGSRVRARVVRGVPFAATVSCDGVDPTDRIVRNTDDNRDRRIAGVRSERIRTLAGLESTEKSAGPSGGRRKRDDRQTRWERIEKNTSPVVDAVPLLVTVTV